MSGHTGEWFDAGNPASVILRGVNQNHLGDRPKHFEDCLPGENVLHEDQSITYHSQIGRLLGSLIVTTYRVRFIEKNVANREGCRFDVPLGCISKVEKFGHSSMNREQPQAYGIVLSCKDMREVRFFCSRVKNARRTLVDIIVLHAFPASNRQPFFAVAFAQSSEVPKDMNGWNLYEARRELRRLGVPNEQWRVMDRNMNYQFADTYPKILAVPKDASDSLIDKVGEARSKQRIPVLSWLHPTTQAAITRAAQPMVGVSLGTRKSVDDEAYLKLIVQANANAHQLIIFDARPIANARMNKAKGGGYEEAYEDCSISFLGIHNIHVVRESLRKVKSALFPVVDDKNYLKLLDESRWLSHLQTIIEGSRLIVNEVEQRRSSVLVHCSDGWDRTAQLTSLAMLQLDPFYRTIEGFAVLIEKEWCSFGHKFGQRLGHGDDKAGDQERAPIFVQFMDCVWQLISQYPCYFEFTPRLLIVILDELYSCRFGTFLYNSEKQRLQEHACHKNTVSLWTHILLNRRQFLNPLYNNGGGQRSVLIINSSIKLLKVWTEYYARYNSNVIVPMSQMTEMYALGRAIGRRDILQAFVNKPVS